MFRSLSFLGVIYTLGILGLLGLMGKNVYNYYENNNGNLLAFLDTDVNMPFAKEKSKIGVADLSKDDIGRNNAENTNVSPSSGTNANTGNEAGLASRNEAKRSTQSVDSDKNQNNEAKALKVSQGSKKNRSNKQPQKARNENSDFVSLLSANDNRGSYLVLAGSFSLTSNAIDRVQALQQAGYKNAQIMRFENSILETVIAGRYTDQQKADELASIISNSLGYSAYVHKQIY